MDSPLSLRPQPSKKRGPQSVADFIQRVSAEPGGFRSLGHEEIRRCRRRLDATRRAAAAGVGTDNAGDKAVEDKDGMLEDEEDDDDEEEEEEAAEAAEADEKEKQEAKAKDLAVARDEMRLAVETAHFNARLTLDFVSLLLSKEEPTRAIDTISPDLRGLVGIGTMGATVLDAPTGLARSRVADHKLVAMGKRLVDIGRVSDSVLAAAARLRRESGLEARYWHDVLAVREQGWAVFRLPHDPLAVAVEFGFSSSAAADFKAGSVAPMRRRAADGAAVLEAAPRFAASKRIQVSIQQVQPQPLDAHANANGNGTSHKSHNAVVVVGRSSLPRPLPEDAPLEDRVREARDTIFAQELWFELNREGRTLLGQGIRAEQDQITYTPARGRGRTICFRLVDLESDDDDDDDDDDEQQQEKPGTGAQPAPEDGLAEIINLAIHLHLTNAHRQNSLRRNEQTLAPAGGARHRGAPPQSSSGAAGGSLNNNNNNNNNIPPPYALLLPIITYLQHEEIIQELTTFLSALTTLLRSAGVPAASYILAEPPVPSALAAGLSPPEALVSGLLRPPDLQIDLTLTPEARLRIVATRSQTVPVPLFHVTLLPPLPVPSASSASDRQSNSGGGGGSNSNSNNGRNILAQRFPPSVDVYPSFGELLWYLCGAVPRALTMLSVPLAIRATTTTTQAQAQAQADQPPSQQQQQEGHLNLAVHLGGCGLVDETTLRYGVRFACVLHGAKKASGRNGSGGTGHDHDGNDEDEDDDYGDADDNLDINGSRENGTASLDSATAAAAAALPLPQLRAHAVFRAGPGDRAFASRAWRWRIVSGGKAVCSAGPGPDGNGGEGGGEYPQTVEGVVAWVLQRLGG